jgi:hypothetical protein
VTNLRPARTEIEALATHQAAAGERFTARRCLMSFNVALQAIDLPDDLSGAAAVPVAVIDGPYDAAAPSGILALGPASLGENRCDVGRGSAGDQARSSWDFWAPAGTP